MVRISSKMGKFWLWSEIWSWRSRSIAPQNNRDLNQGLFQLWSKFCDPSLNGSRVITQTSKWLTHRLTHTRTHTQTQAMTIPEGQNWPRVKTILVNTLLCISCWKYEWDVAYYHFTIAMTIILSRGPRIKLTSWLSCDIWYFLSNWIRIESSQWVIDRIVLEVHPLSMHHLITIKSVGPVGISLERGKS